MNFNIDKKMKFKILQLGFILLFLIGVYIVIDYLLKNNYFNTNTYEGYSNMSLVDGFPENWTHGNKLTESDKIYLTTGKKTNGWTFDASDFTTDNIESSDTPFVPINRGKITRWTYDYDSGQKINLMGNSWYMLRKGHKIRRFHQTRDYKFEITIHPLEKRGGWSNIFHSTISGGNCCGARDRVPAAWFYSNTTRLHIRTGTNRSGNFGHDPPGELPLNKDTRLVITVKDNKLTIKLQGGYNYTKVITIPVERQEGTNHFWLSDPWHNAAIAKVKNVSFTNLNRNSHSNSDIYTNTLPEISKFSKDRIETRVGSVNNTDYITHMWHGYVYYDRTTIKHFGVTGDDDCFLWIIKGKREMNSFNYPDGAKINWITENIPDATLVCGDPNRHGTGSQYHSNRNAHVNMQGNNVLMNAWGSYKFEKDTLYTILLKVTEGGGGQSMYFGINDNTLMHKSPRQSILPQEFFTSYRGNPVKKTSEAITATVSGLTKDISYYPFVNKEQLGDEGSEIYNIVGENFTSIIKGKDYPSIEVKKNYKLEMTLLPTGVKPGLTNIIHVSASGNNEGSPFDRIPAIWFYNNSTRLHIITGTRQNPNDGHDPPGQLPLNTETKLVLTVLDDTMTVELTGGYNYKQTHTIAADREEGYAKMWLGDPWHNDPHLKVKNVSFTNLKAIHTMGNFEYKLARTNRNWMDHYNEAKKWGGNLASIHSEQEDDFVKKIVKDSGMPTSDWRGPFLGGERIPGKNGKGGGAEIWRWTDGTRWNYEKYIIDSEPNNYNWQGGSVENKYPADAAETGEDAIQLSYAPTLDWSDTPKRVKRAAIYKRPVNYESFNDYDSNVNYNYKKFININKNITLIPDIKYRITTMVNIGDDNINDNLHYIVISGQKRKIIYPNAGSRDYNGYYKIDEEFIADSRRLKIQLISEVSSNEGKTKPVKWKELTISYKECDTEKCQFKPCDKSPSVPDGYSGHFKYGSLDLPTKKIGSTTYYYKHINHQCKEGVEDCDDDENCGNCQPGKLLLDETTKKNVGYLWPGSSYLTSYSVCVDKEAAEQAKIEEEKREESLRIAEQKELDALIEQQKAKDEEIELIKAEVKEEREKNENLEKDYESAQDKLSYMEKAAESAEKGELRSKFFGTKLQTNSNKLDTIERTISKISNRQNAVRPWSSESSEGNIRTEASYVSEAAPNNDNITF